MLTLTLITVGKYIFDPAMQAYLGDRVPYERRGRVLAITELGWSLSFILGVPLMGFLIARFGWIASFPVLAIAGGYLAELIEAGQAILAYQIVNAWLQHHVECVRQDSVTGNPV